MYSIFTSKAIHQSLWLDIIFIDIVGIKCCCNTYFRYTPALKNVNWAK